jgi:hypothetical protein
MFPEQINYTLLMQEIRTRGIKMIISDTGILSEIMKNQLKKWMWE